MQVTRVLLPSPWCCWTKAEAAPLAGRAAQRCKAVAMSIYITMRTLKSKNIVLHKLIFCVCLHNISWEKASSYHKEAYF